MSETAGLITGDDGRDRCFWHGNLPDYLRYHDEEWGRPVTDDFRLFEKLCLEGFQSGLSWLTILRKRENFRAGFDGFDFHKVAHYDQSDVERLLADAGIIRHRGKIEAAINNAARAIEMEAEFGDLLFTLVNYVRHLDIDADAALRGANARFAARVRHMDAAVRAEGHTLSELDLDALEARWREAKSSAAPPTS